MPVNHTSKLSILILSTFDSMNYWIPPFVDELIRVGHNYRIITRDDSDFLNTKMFPSGKYNVTSSSFMSPDVVDDFDFVVLPPIYVSEFKELVNRVIEKGIFTISYSFLFSSVVMRCQPDILLTLGESKFNEFKENYLEYPCIAIGNPQYDKLIDRPSVQKTINEVLIIDQGGYPYGATGKQQFIDTITRIATANPSLHFTLKPRYTKAEIGSGQTTHQMSESLSDFLSGTVPNLSIIETPVILEDIILNYDAMISTWSTAYCAAMIARIPQIILEGFDSIDVFDVRNVRIDQAYNHLRKSGAVIHYREIDPCKLEFKYPNEEYINQNVYQATTPSAPKIITLLEFLKTNLIDTMSRVKCTFQFNCQDFYSNFNQLIKISATSADFFYWSKLRFELNLIIQEAVYQNRCLGNKLNLVDLQDFIKNCLDHYDMQLPITNYTEQANDLLLQAKENLFHSDNIYTIMENDVILQDLYLEWLYETKKHEQILTTSYPYICNGSLNYYRALIYLPNHKIKAFNLLFSFLDELFSRNNTILFRKERRLAQSLIPFYRGINKYFLYLYLILTKKYIVFTYLSEGAVANNAIMTYFKLKYYIGVKQYQIADATFRRFSHKYASKKRNGLSEKFMFMLMKSEYKKVEKKM